MPPSRPAPGWSVGKWIAAILAVAVHLAFVVFLVFSVDWQNREPEPVSVELYAPQPVTPKAAAPVPRPPKPEPEPPKPQPEPPKPEPEPPKPAPEPPKPIAKPEPPPPTKAEIALKEKQEQQRKKEQAERERKEKERIEAEKKKLEEKRLAEVRERQKREADALMALAAREQAVAARAADAARARANEDYIRRIQAKVKGYVVVPPEIAGNPEAIFDVVQLPTGEIIDTQLRKSSGNRAYDEAVQRAIIKASPLPRPDAPDLFRRNLTLKFRPLD
ncbi:MAG: energy transducer TonB [Casimicrobiaceae bacterium]